MQLWNRLYSLPYLCEKYLRGEIRTKAEQRQVKKMAKKYRKWLMNISWFMKNSFQKDFSDDIPDILNRLELDPETWVEEMKQFRTDGISAVGTVSQLQDFC